MDETYTFNTSHPFDPTLDRPAAMEAVGTVESNKSDT